MKRGMASGYGRIETHPIISANELTDAIPTL